MAKKLGILCFGDSLTAGYYCYGLHYHPYAGKLGEKLKAAFPDTEMIIDVNGVPGDLAISPPGHFLPRIQDKCFSTQYDWVIVLGGTNDLGHRHQPNDMYSALQGSWNVALASGANVLALTVPECAARSQELDDRRDQLNAYILSHKAERFHAFDLRREIPCHSTTEEFRQHVFDDGLHLTPAGYDMVGESVGEYLVQLLNSESDKEKQQN